jgi:ATP-dependent Clp protease ATP-binding subunit ClpA
MGRLSLTPLAQRVVEGAIQESRDRGDNHVGTEHLVLGMLRGSAREGVACEVLEGLGLTADKFREGIKELLQRAEQPKAPTPDKSVPTWTVSATLLGTDSAPTDPPAVLAAKISAAAAIVTAFANTPIRPDHPLQALWQDSVAFLAEQFAADDGNPTATVEASDVRA